MAPAEDVEPVDGREPEPVLVVPQSVRDYFQGSGMSLQDYFRFPEMKQIKNPVHEYFSLHDGLGDTHWIEEGTLPIEEGDDGWVMLGAEHQELARIAVAKGGNRHYYAIAWDGSYLGPVLRTTSTVVGAGWYLVKGAASITGLAVASVVFAVLRPSPPIPSPDAPLMERFLEESVEINGDTWWFRVWVPPDLDRIRKEDGSLPAFLLLHGFKECGWDNWCQTNAGLALHLQKQRWADWFPGIVVIPQLPRRPWDEQWWQHWRNPQMQKLAMACLEKAVCKYSADRNRCYLLGESLGAEGAWSLAAAHPGVFAAVGGSCGSVEPYDWMNWEWGSSPDKTYRELAEAIGRDTPMWFCHGAQDDFVPIEQSKKFQQALQDARQTSAVGAILGRVEAAEVVFRQYEDLDHHVWDRAYQEDDLITWLTSHKKP